MLAYSICGIIFSKMQNRYNGGRGIRTPGTVPRTAVFKTAGFNHSPIPPPSRILLRSWDFQILDRQVLLAIRGFGPQFNRSGIRVGVLNRDLSELCLSAQRYKSVPF